MWRRYPKFSAKRLPNDIVRALLTAEFYLQSKEIFQRWRKIGGSCVNEDTIKGKIYLQKEFNSDEFKSIAII